MAVNPIVKWFKDPETQKMVDFIVNETYLYTRQRDEELLNKYFPIKEKDSRNLLGYITSKTKNLASVIAYGGNVPRTQSGQLRKITSQLFKVGLRYVWDEDVQWQMAELMEICNLKNVRMYDHVDPNTGIPRQGESNDLADILFGKQKDLVIAVMDLLRKMTFDVIQTGKVNYTDPRTGTTAIIDWSKADPKMVYADHFPSPLVATGNADPTLNKFTDYDDANFIKWAEKQVENYVYRVGRKPSAMLMSQKCLNHIKSQKSIIAMNLVFNNSLPASVPLSTRRLNEILVDNNLPPIIIFDETYDQEDANGDVTNGVRFHDINRISFLYADGQSTTGERLIGTTMESKGSLYGKPKTGIHVETVESKQDDVAAESKAVATLLPMSATPTLLFSQKVFDDV